MFASRCGKISLCALPAESPSAASMSLPRPVREELRDLDLDVQEGKLSDAEADAMVEAVGRHATFGYSKF
jgi:hypothetical protein